MVQREQVLEALRKVRDPDLGRDIVDLGFVKDLQIEGGEVAFAIELTTPACPVKERLEGEARQLVAELPGVTDVRIRMTSQVRSGSIWPALSDFNIERSDLP